MPALLAGLFFVGASMHAQVVQGGSTSGLNRLFDFDTVPNPSSPWTPYVTITGPGVVIGERLVGQTTATNGFYEIVSGAPKVPLAIDGWVQRTSGVSVFKSNGTDLNLGPEGTAGWPLASSLGEGSFTVLFELDQRTVGLSVTWADLANQAQVLFYDRSGRLIGSLGATYRTTGSVQVPMVFTVKSGPRIAAMTVNNTDPGGLGYDHLRYAHTAITLSGFPVPGGAVTFALSESADAGLGYQLGSSFGTGPTAIGNRFLHLSVDDLLVLSVSGLLPGTFVGYTGRLDATGRATAQLRIPDVPALKGMRVHSAFVTLDSQSPFGVRTVSASATFSIQ